MPDSNYRVWNCNCDDTVSCLPLYKAIKPTEHPVKNAGYLAAVQPTQSRDQPSKPPTDQRQVHLLDCTQCHNIVLASSTTMQQTTNFTSGDVLDGLLFGRQSLQCPLPGHQSPQVC